LDLRKLGKIHNEPTHFYRKRKTPIEKLSIRSAELGGPAIYMKGDDPSGTIFCLNWQVAGKSV